MRVISDKVKTQMSPWHKPLFCTQLYCRTIKFNTPVVDYQSLIVKPLIIYCHLFMTLMFKCMLFFY